jgi:dCMP deaminase
MTDFERVRRPTRADYYMGIALAVRRRANCLGNRVGALLVLDDRVIATGYNGTPQNMRNCDEGGCERCANRDKYRSSQGYDVCICVHAEQNALLTAARFGVATQGAELYTTMRPCFGCTKELLQARVRAVYYLHDWEPPSDLQLAHQYEIIQKQFPGGIAPIDVDDPDAAWAISRLREAPVAADRPPR